MTDKLAIERVVSVREMVAAPRPLSHYFREVEADMVARLARDAHMHGKQFDDWPEFEVVEDDNVWARMLRYRARVECS